MRPPGRRTAMCGIFGYVGHAQNAADLVLRGLKKLEYRGYDSWGVAVGHRDQVVLAKRTGKIGDAAPDLPASAIGIGHTRWATHGGVTEPNAHPHLDCAGRLALIHNGIVSNYRELREPLVRSGHRFRSETDTEVVAHLIEECLAATPAGPEQLLSATMTAFRRLHGLNAIAVADVRTGQIAAAKSGSPLVLGWSDHGHLLASDFSALLEHTRRVTFVEDRQAVLLSRERCRVFDADSGRELTPAITEVEWEAAATELSGYPDYMTKEIHEQPSVLRRLAEAGGEHARRLAAMIRDAADVFVVGCGTAGHAALAAQYLLARIAGRRVTVATGSEFPYLMDFVREGALVIALSQSGETIDVIDAVRAARQRGARVGAQGERGELHPRRRLRRRRPQARSDRAHRAGHALPRAGAAGRDVRRHHGGRDAGEGARRHADRRVPGAPRGVRLPHSRGRPGARDGHPQRATGPAAGLLPGVAARPRSRQAAQPRQERDRQVMALRQRHPGRPRQDHLREAELGIDHRGGRAHR